ncbi:unnamed protein product [Moneuplotes crassus]|uniref:FAR1 domain-containing protein n=1 Tax=Euplotes crassus TaxID=5936 RepID=A0AAD1U3C5_EUPCR|nr:unnamed protein product [Moneuplotes crassus]
MNILEAALTECVRCTFAVRGKRPVLLKVNKRYDSTEAIVNTLINKFNLLPYLRYWLTLENGAIVDDLKFIDKDDIIIIEPFATPYRPFPMKAKKIKKEKEKLEIDPGMMGLYNQPNYFFQPQNLPSLNKVQDMYCYGQPMTPALPCNPYAINEPQNLEKNKNSEGQRQEHLQQKMPEIDDNFKLDPPQNIEISNQKCFDKVGDRLYYEQPWGGYELVDPHNNQIDLGPKPAPVNFNDYTCQQIFDALDSKFLERDDLIERVRDESKRHGFNICIPRGDSVLNDGTTQITLYCDKYGSKRKRTQHCKERYSKKTNCKWKIKFQKLSGYKHYELVKGEVEPHNHYLNPDLANQVKPVRRKSFSLFGGSKSASKKNLKKLLKQSSYDFDKQESEDIIEENKSETPKKTFQEQNPINFAPVRNFYTNEDLIHPNYPNYPQYPMMYPIQNPSNVFRNRYESLPIQRMPEMPPDLDLDINSEENIQKPLSQEVPLFKEEEDLRANDQPSQFNSQDSIREKTKDTTDLQMFCLNTQERYLEQNINQNTQFDFPQSKSKPSSRGSDDISQEAALSCEMDPLNMDDIDTKSVSVLTELFQDYEPTKTQNSMVD